MLLLFNAKNDPSISKRHKVMEKIKYKLRCRNNGIVVTTNPSKYNIVWIRKFNPNIYPIDNEQK